MTTDNDYDSIITEQARFFGRGDRHGGWTWAVCVARCVQRGQGTGRGSPADADGKVSARTFADRADASHTRVLHYLDAWEWAAGEGLVPHADTLMPDSDPELPDAEQWDEFYMRYDRWAPQDAPVPPALPGEAGAAPSGAPARQAPAPAPAPRGYRQRDPQTLLASAVKDIRRAGWILTNDPSAAGAEIIRAEVAQARGALNAIMNLVGGETQADEGAS